MAVVLAAPRSVADDFSIWRSVPSLLRPAQGSLPCAASQCLVLFPPTTLSSSLTPWHCQLQCLGHSASVSLSPAASAHPSGSSLLSNSCPLTADSSPSVTSVIHHASMRKYYSHSLANVIAFFILFSPLNPGITTSHTRTNPTTCLSCPSPLPQTPKLRLHPDPPQHFASCCSEGITGTRTKQPHLIAAVPANPPSCLTRPCHPVSCCLVPL